MIFYTSDGNRYIGMDQDTICKLREELGLPAPVFVDEETYNALISSFRIR